MFFFVQTMVSKIVCRKMVFRKWFAENVYRKWFTENCCPKRFLSENDFPKIVENPKFSEISKLSKFQNFGVVGKLEFCAFQRHQNHQNPINIGRQNGAKTLFLAVPIRASTTLIIFGRTLNRSIKKRLEFSI